MNTRGISASATRARRATGGMFFSAFGAAWACWASLVEDRQAVVPLVLACAVGLALFVASFRQYRAHRGSLEAVRGTAAARRVTRVFLGVNVAQWSAVFIAANQLEAFHLASWTVPARTTPATSQRKPGA